MTCNSGLPTLLASSLLASSLLASSLLAVLPALAQLPALSPEEAAAKWHNLASLPLEGKGWTNTTHPYDRLPASAESLVRPPVWNLSHDSAGMLYRFSTDATLLRVRWKLRKPARLALPHMPATGVSGLDLYVRDAGQWRWLANGRPEAGENEKTLVRGLAKKRREFLLYLPLYNGVESVELGLPEGSTLSPGSPPRARKPIVFYGTSILQGGCASRPGMAYPAILGRMLDWPVINLGFSGNGKTEPEMARLLAELDPAAYVMDSLPNLSAAETAERVEPFVRTLRAAHPSTPIVLVENVNYTNSGFVESSRAKVADANRILRRIHDSLKRSGDRHVHYVASWQLYGGDGEDTVDGSHATDLGFLRMARGMAPVLREALQGAGLDAPEEEGFESLFDGKTLSGWKIHQGVPKEHIGGRWWVEDGALTGTQDPPGKGGFLWLDRPFSDFVLRLETRLDYPVDSGVFLRVGPDGKSHQVTLDYRPGSDIGAIYLPWTRQYVHRNFEGVRALRKDEWNRMEIRIEGEPSRIRFVMNGYLLTDFQHTAATTSGVPPSGGIALQVHPDVGKLTLWKGNNKVRFRNIRIRELR